MPVARTGQASCPHNAAAPPPAVGRLTYWKDGVEVEVTESDLPEEQALWESVTTAPLWDLVQAKQAAAPPSPAPSRSAAEPAAPAKASPSRTALQISKMDFTVNSLIDKINRGKVNLRPAYQREYVWTTRTASRLVESLLLNVPIPTLFLNETDSGCLEVVDGKQRLTSIWSFLMGEFPDGTPFRLNGLEVYEELNGLTFAQLGEAQQETIKDYALSIHTIGRQSQPDFVFEVFERLNMGATQLNEQELRNCIYQGGYTELLGALVSNPHLLQIYKAQAPHLRMRDRELLLRFFALLRAGPAGFCSPVKAWLNAEMRARRELPAEEAASMRAAFERAIQLSWEVFGENAFRPVREGAAGEPPSFDAGEVNVALWDTVMYSMAFADRAHVLARKEAVLAAFMALAGDSKFKRLLVSQPKAVIARAEAWAKVLERVLA